MYYVISLAHTKKAMNLLRFGDQKMQVTAILKKWLENMKL